MVSICLNLYPHTYEQSILTHIYCTIQIRYPIDRYLLQLPACLLHWCIFQGSIHHYFLHHLWATTLPSTPTIHYYNHYYYHHY